MRLDVVGDTLLEKLGTALGIVPSPVVHVSFGLGYSRGIIAGVRLGFFDAIARGEQIDGKELARRTECSEAGTVALANALAGFGLLRRRGGLYGLTRASSRWLRSDAERSLRDVVLFLGYVAEMVSSIEEDVRTGVVQRVHDKEHPPAFWDAYMRALWTFAALGGPEVRRTLRKAGALKRADGSPAQRVLDVGGGHGRYGAVLCAAIPGMRSEVLDLPPACAVGRTLAEVTEGGDALSFTEGDFRDVPWGGERDLVLLFNVLHNATESESEDLIRRAYDALVPGGYLVVSDAAHGKTEGEAIDASAGYNELFFYVVSGAQAWPEARIVGWMAEAGFEPARTSRLLSAPQVVLVARRPEG